MQLVQPLTSFSNTSAPLILCSQFKYPFIKVWNTLIGPVDVLFHWYIVYLPSWHKSFLPTGYINTKVIHKSCLVSILQIYLTPTCIYVECSWCLHEVSLTYIWYILTYKIKKSGPVKTLEVFHIGGSWHLTDGLLFVIFWFVPIRCESCLIGTSSLYLEQTIACLCSVLDCILCDL